MAVLECVEPVSRALDEYRALNPSGQIPVVAQWFVDMNDGKGTKPSKALADWSKMRMKELDGWLANREFVATNEFTVADILMTHVLGVGDVGTGDHLKPYANIVAYRARCLERPAWKKTIGAYCERVEAA